MASTASTAGSESRWPTAAAKSPGSTSHGSSVHVPPSPTGTGTNPSAERALAANTAGLLLFVTMATRFPRGTGCEASTRTVSSSWRTVGTLMTPACW